MQSYFKQNVFLIHHWLLGMRGGEKVLEQLALMFPGAPIHTLVAHPPSLSPVLQKRHIHTTPLQSLGGRRFHRQFMPFFPRLIPTLRVGSPGGLVISSDASVIKGASVHPRAFHLCYCHSPPRYLWDRQADYENQSGLLGGITRLVFRHSVPHVREFDRQAAQRVNLFIANSRFVQERIKNYYSRDSVIIHPPVDVGAFDPTRPREDFFLIVSELVPYKKVAMAVEAFRGLPHRLVIIGDGPERKAIERLAGPNIRLLGRQPFRVLKDHMERCRAFLYPQVEDFGITAVEAQAAGAPVIALGVGGATETVLHRQTGLLFTDQTEAGLIQAVQEFLGSGVDYCGTDLHRHAERFSQARFRTAFQSVINKYLSSDLPHK